MKIELHEINVTLSKEQKQEIHHALENREDIRLFLKKYALRGNDTLIVPLKKYEELDDIPNGTDAVIDESTFDEMWEEVYPNGEPEEVEDSYELMWEYFGLPFYAAIDESFEGKGIDFSLNYSLLNDLEKDFVENYIKWKQNYIQLM